MAVPPQNVIPAVSGNSLVFAVEIIDAPVHVVGNDAGFQIVQNTFQVLSVRYNFSQGKIGHGSFTGSVCV